MKSIKATLTRTRTFKPLVQLDGDLFNGVELTPAQLRWIAQTLIHIAELSDAHLCTGKHYRDATQIYTEVSA
ncbi:MAG: hypothetical protein QM533_11505 [Cytophagales bacterium]|nr:hypothetical protein [Cytophagales bacterium]